MVSDVGFEVGAAARVQMLVLQIHYVHPIAASAPGDNSGLRLTITDEK